MDTQPWEMSHKCIRSILKTGPRNKYPKSSRHKAHTYSLTNQKEMINSPTHHHLKSGDLHCQNLSPKPSKKIISKKTHTKTFKQINDQLKGLLIKREKNAAKNHVIRNYNPNFNYTNLLYSSPMIYSNTSSPNSSGQLFQVEKEHENRLNSYINDLTSKRIEQYREKLEEQSQKSQKRLCEKSGNKMMLSTDATVSSGHKKRLLFSRHLSVSGASPNIMQELKQRKLELQKKYGTHGIKQKSIKRITQKSPSDLSRSDKMKRVESPKTISPLFNDTRWAHHQYARRDKPNTSHQRSRKKVFSNQNRNNFVRASS